MNLMFICPITTLFTLFIRISFKISNGPSSQLFSIVLKVNVGLLVLNQNQTLDSQRYFTISFL